MLSMGQGPKAASSVLAEACTVVAPGGEGIPRPTRTPLCKQASPQRQMEL